MCGIAGSVNLPLTQNVLLNLHHRGPDSHGLINDICGNHYIALGQTRLAILELSDAGYQPMTDNSENFTLVFNGEIYNHLELRMDLGEYEFRGHSDTETLLYFLIKNGADGLKKLNGIFSLALYDRHAKKVLLARDPFGVKPLYFYHQDNKIAFASELGVIREIIGPTELDHDCLYRYFRLRFCPSPLTLFKGVQKLEPGHYISVSLGEIDITVERNFYSYRPVKNKTIGFTGALDEYDRRLRAAIERQIIADVPIAIMLSGGVDSALLAFLAQDITGKTFDTFTVGFDLNTNANELSDAAATARWLGTRHNELVLSGESFARDSAEIVRILEEPVGSQSLYPFYHLTQKIHQDGFKVALSGQGVDEAMGGYNRYNFQNFFDTVSHPFWRLIKPTNRLIRKDIFRRGLNALAEQSRAKRFIESYSFFNMQELRKILAPDLRFDAGYEDRLIALLEGSDALYGLKEMNGLDHMLMLDMRMALSEDLLLYTDKISMHFSLEVRVPFLDVELIQFVESLPTEYKTTLIKNKILHKRLAEKYLPKDFIYRKKKGFYIPRNEWYKSAAGLAIRDEVLGDESVFSDLIDKKAFISMFDAHRSGLYNYEDQIFSILNLYYWVRANCRL